MKSVRAATCILIVGLLATVCPAASPIQSFGYPSVLPPQTQARPEVRVAALGFRDRSAASTNSSAACTSEGCADYGARAAVPTYVGTAAPFQPTPPLPVQRVASVGNSTYPSNSTWGAPAAQSASCGYQPGNQYLSGGWSGCAPVQLPCACPTWFGGLYALVMGIDDDRNFWVATSDADPNAQFLNTRSVGHKVAGGAEVRFGKTFDNCRWGLEFVYWGLYPAKSSYGSISSYDVVGNLEPTLDFTDISLTTGTGPGVPVSSIISGDPNADGIAAPVRTFEVSRSYQVNNVEINLLSGPLRSGGSGQCVPAGGRWTTNWLFGFRHLKFDEALRIIYENGDGVIDYDVPYVVGNNDQVYFDLKTENDLAGVQWGIDSDYALSRRLRFGIASRFGVYGNHANQRSREFNSWGDADLDLSPGDSYNLRSSNNGLSFMGELRLGVSYLVGTRWRATAGYRAVAATGIARAVGQIPIGSTLHAVDQNRTLDHDGSLVVQGGYFGAEYGW